MSWTALLALLVALMGAAPLWASDVVTLSPRVIAVGKWPEGLAFASGRLFVAESGQRTLAAIDPKSGRLLNRTWVGRLPVGVSVGPGDVVDTLVQTDRLVWRQTTAGRALPSFKGLEGCPAGLDARGAYVWVLTQPSCSSVSGRAIRINPANGARASSSLLGDSPQAILARPGRTWVAHARAPALSAINEASLAVSTFAVADASLWSLSQGGEKLFAGGRLQSRSDEGLVVMLDRADGHEIHRQLVDERVNAIVSDETHVVAIGDKGRMWVFSAGDLEYLRTIDLNTGPFEPRGAVIAGGSLYVSDSRSQSAAGAVLALDDWRPAAPTNPPAAKASGMTTECPYSVVNVPLSEMLWMYEQPDPASTKVAGLAATDNGLILQHCAGDWCYVLRGEQKGWVAKANIGAVCH